MRTYPKNTPTEQLSRKDRWGAFLVVLLALVLLALIVLGTIFGEPRAQPLDYWHMMP